MAAIDKLYLHTYDELVELKQWALAYYPKLFIYFYNWAFEVTRDKWNSAVERNALISQKRVKDDWERMSSDGTVNCAVAYIKREWHWTDEDDAREVAEQIRANAFMSLDSLKESVKFPIMNTPLSVDKKLKWICPLPAIRLYLQEQCGVKEHWYYKLFWRGKKHF